MTESRHVEMFTDGACSGNPGPGGWGAIMRWKGHEKELSGGEHKTTNNRMELTAVIRGLAALSRRCKVELYTDSQYVQKGVHEYLAGWKAKGWPERIKNQDLWKELDTLLQKHDVRLHWVRGHDGHPENERADALARAAVPKLR
ncbi:MAG: ribonuclease HI [Micavibrio aeruginosavorus]|uniref:Ribonuclease H n=1 Tax=Micavibrio aeruginosavorus TaxID=349221 RepID=A0A7T5R460_9BACT|nr:MAG: ribonuclease HI [Micavibrio aeruginosavorus]